MNFDNTSALLDHLGTHLMRSLKSKAKEQWAKLKSKTGTASELQESFGGLVRVLGRDPVVEPTHDDRFQIGPDFQMDLAAFRAADVGAMLLLRDHLAAGGDPEVLRSIFDGGDLDERSGVMRCLLVIPRDAPVLGKMFGEAQRANAADIYEAAWCDHDLAIQCLPAKDFQRMILKLAFNDIPLWRALRATEGASPELSRMLEDFAVEREAAGRPIWPDTLTLQALAPVKGTRERLQRYVDSDDPELAQRAAGGLTRLK